MIYELVSKKDGKRAFFGRKQNIFLHILEMLKIIFASCFKKNRKDQKEKSLVYNKRMLSSILEAFEIKLSNLKFNVLFQNLNSYRHEITCFDSCNLAGVNKNKNLKISFPIVCVKFSYYVATKNKKVYFKNPDWQNILVPIDYRTQEQEKSYLLSIINKYLKEKKCGIKFDTLNNPTIGEGKSEKNWPKCVCFYLAIYEISLSDEQFEKLKNVENFHD